MNTPVQPTMVLFVGGPLHGQRTSWTNPPNYHPHATAGGMVPYSRCNLSVTVEGVDAVYAPVGMSESAIVQELRSALY